MTNIQKQVQYDRVMRTPGSTESESVVKYGTDLIQDEVHDEKVMPKSGIRKNKLVAK